MVDDGSDSKRPRLSTSPVPVPVPLPVLAVVSEGGGKGVQVRGLTVTHLGGYRSARLSLGLPLTCRQPTALFCELRLHRHDAASSSSVSSSTGGSGGSVPPRTSPHWRVGVATSASLLSAPLGYGAAGGCSIRDIDGSLVVRSRRLRTSSHSVQFGAGDTIGLLLVLTPPPSDTTNESARVSLEIWLNGKALGELAHELDLTPPPPPAPSALFPPASAESKVARVFAGVSLHYGAAATFTLAPPFAHPPPPLSSGGIRVRPYSELPALLQEEAAAMLRFQQLPSSSHDAPITV